MRAESIRHRFSWLTQAGGPRAAIPYTHRRGRTARANALFASALQRSDNPSTAQVRQAIAAAIRTLGARGCAAQVAHAYGEDPETAVMRMRWAQAEVTGTFGQAQAELVRATAPDPSTVPGGSQAA
jgi:hypothetical protein